MDRLRFDAHEVLRRAGTKTVGVQDVGTLVDQVKVILDDVNLLLLKGTGLELQVQRDLAADPAGMKFEIILD